MKRIAGLIFLALFSLWGNAAFAACNTNSGFVKSYGTFNIGDLAFFGPDCEHVSGGGLGALGSITIAPAAGFNQGFAMAATISGSSLPAAGNSLGLMLISGDTVNAGGQFVNGWNFAHTFGGAAATGGRLTVSCNQTFTAATNAANTNRNYVCGNFQSIVQSGDGGTDLLAGAKGAFFPLASWVDVQIGTNILDIGQEHNISMRNGTSVRFKKIMGLVDHNLDVITGSQLDTYMAVSRQTGGVGIRDGINFSDYAGDFPLYSTGNLIRTQTISGTTFTVNNGIDFSSGVFFAGCAFKSPGVCIDQSGTLNASSAVAPNIQGGATAASTLNLYSTNGAGTTDSINFFTGTITRRAQITTGGFVTLGSQTNNTGVGLWINQHANSASTLQGAAGTDLQISGGDAAGGASTVFLLDAYNGINTITLRRSDGSASSRTGLTTSDVIGQFSYQGYNGTSNSGNQAQLRCEAAEVWSVTNEGTLCRTRATKIGTTTMADVMVNDGYGHVSFGNAAPTVTACGTGTVTANSSDAGGQVTATGATSCTVTFAGTYVSAPTCVANDNTTVAALKVVTTAANMTVSNLTAGDVFSWVCLGKIGL